MTPQELKNSILQLAIQGKLVPQRAEEGTAEELYNQIQAEKQNLIKAGKIKKEKLLPAITDDEKPFEIPDSWKWVRLGDLLEVIGGVSYKKTDIAKQGVRILRGGNIQNFKVLFNEDDVFLPLTYSDDDKNVRAGDIIVVASTGSKNVIGKAAYVDIEVGNTMVGAFLRICRSYYAQIVDYLKYLFDSHYYRQHIRDMAQGTNINNVKESYITELLYPLPPLAEQKRIVAKIEELLPYVERYEKAYNELQQLNKRFPGDLQKSVLQLAIQGRLVSQCPEEGNAEDLYKQIQAEKQNLIKAGKIKKEKPLPAITDDEKPFEIPQSWKWVRLGEIGITQTGNTPSKANLEYFGTDIPFITPGDIANNNVNYNNQGLSNIGKNVARIGEKNTILQVCIGGSIGKSAIMDKIVAFNQQINSVYPIFIDCRYLHKVISSVYFITEMKEKAGGTATPIINRGIWNTLLVPLPPLAEQKRIIAKLEEILPLCDKLK